MTKNNKTLLAVFTVLLLLLISCEKDPVETNSPPTDITLSNSAIPENQPAFTEVGKFTAVDKDNDDEFTWTLTDDASGNFALFDDVLKTTQLLSNDVQAAYSISVKVRDLKDESFEKSFTITVVNNVA